MKHIGAWDTIKSIRCQPVKQMQVSLIFIIKLCFKRNLDECVYVFGKLNSGTEIKLIPFILGVGWLLRRIDYI